MPPKEIARGKKTATDVFAQVDLAIAQASELLKDWTIDAEDVTVNEIPVQQFDFEEPFGVVFEGGDGSSYFRTLEEALQCIADEGDDSHAVMLHIMRPFPDYNHKTRSGYCEEAIIWWDKSKGSEEMEDD